MAPRYGALGATFQLARIFQICSLIAIIGMTANFISSIVSNDATPPNILIGTISVVSIKTIYSILATFLTYRTDLHRRDILHHYRHPLLRRYPPVPPLRHPGLPPPHCTHCRGGRYGQTAVVSPVLLTLLARLQGCGRIRLHVAPVKRCGKHQRDNRFRLVDWSVEDYLLGDKGDLGT